MKVIMYIFGGLILLVVASVIYNSSTKETENPQTDSVDKLSYSQISEEVKMDQAVLYDVRTAAEFAEGHAADAVNFDLQLMQAGQLPNIDKNTKIYVYCRSGNRSAQAASLLKQAGFTNITDLGGLSDIQNLGAELVK
ncbi:rhodanese-like domain-containing protein [Candidatus Nomurabacteria bacterium]|nr:rhodanese-like domain-containing protein [Candidatus Nomurabacteria bacterium]